MDLSRYPPEQRRFINRFYGACFRYFPQHYDSDVIVYEADTTPLMNVPQFLSRWRGFAPRAQSLRVPGTHHCLMREPYVAQMAQDMERRIRTYLEAHRA
jgi:thioesterase domain-containing protein